MPIDNVADDDIIATAWGNDVADTINAIELVIADLPVANLADITQARVLGRASGAGTGAVTELTGAQVAAMIATPDVQVFTSGSGSWSKPANARFVDVEVVGGGGSSGGISATAAGEAAASGAGGGGGYSRKTFAASALGSTEPYAVGAGGTAPSAGNNAGNSGGTSSFGAAGTLVQATGGSGGAGMAAPPGGTASATGGNGGVGSSGSINAKGSAGMTSRVITNLVATIAQGGGSVLGGAAGCAINSVGDAGSAYGGGAGGSASSASQSARAGAAGAAGVVIVRTYF